MLVDDNGERDVGGGELAQRRPAAEERPAEDERVDAQQRRRDLAKLWRRLDGDVAQLQTRKQIGARRTVVELQPRLVADQVAQPRLDQPRVEVAQRPQPAQHRQQDEEHQRADGVAHDAPVSTPPRLGCGSIHGAEA
jgi:hypothetical protein